jgi:hypothetical protein
MDVQQKSVQEMLSSLLYDGEADSNVGAAQGGPTHSETYFWETSLSALEMQPPRSLY